MSKMNAMSRFLRLFLLMFLEYAICGAWAPTAAVYFQSGGQGAMNATGLQIGALFLLMPLATIFMPPIFGSLADRFVRTDRLLGLLHVLSGLALFAAAKQTSFYPAMTCLGLHALLYAPTIALTNSLVFAHLDDHHRQFTPIRVAGTIGWMSAGLGLSLWRLKFNAPVGDLFLLGAALSILLGAFSLLLPATPPTHASSNRFAFGKAVKLLKNPSFMALIVVGTVASAMFDYYYLFAGGFLSAPRLEALKAALPESYFNPGAAGLGIPLGKLSAMMTIAQFGELLVMLCLPWLIKRLGIKWVLALGLVAWPLRYALFVFFPSSSVALLGLFIHGLCIPCFLIAGFMYTEQVAPTDIRASAQSLFLVSTQGIGRAAGSLMAGYSQVQNTTMLPSRVSVAGSTDINKLVDWQSMFIIPLGVGLACALVFPFVFRPTKPTKLASE